MGKSLKEKLSHKMADKDQLNTSLKKVLTHGIFNFNLARGLNESCKALEYEHDNEDKKAALCILADDCSDDNYKKLIAGLCKTWKVNLIRVSSRADLGKMAGLYKNDASGVARKVRPCSCVVVKKWPEDVPDLKISIDADLKSAISFLKQQTA